MNGGAGERCVAGYVGLAGWTNVGKSTLLNRLVGVKLAAVADVAQTTRRRIVGALSVPDRGQILFVDTPGIHRPRHRMNRSMVETARQALQCVDVLALVIDASRGFGDGDREAASLLLRDDQPRVAVLNKVDLVEPKSRLLPMIESLGAQPGFEAVVPLSALSGDGCDRLVGVLLDLLPPGPPLFPDDYLTDQPERVLIAEWIREKLLHATREELPHATAVTIERWDERADGLLEIDATVLVERPSQKKIVIGAGGGMLKQVGSAARLEIEAFLERRVMLRLWVRVRAAWRDDVATLQRLGLD